jgi:hypothetical protein
MTVPEVTVTKHAEDRIRKRMGIPKRAVQRTAQLAYDKGEVYSDLGVELEKQECTLNWRSVDLVKVYGEFVFLFDKDATLITVMHKPKHVG